MDFFDIDGQRKRAQEINKLVIELHLKDVTADGTLVGAKWERCGLKELIWFCEALWNTDKKYAKLTENILLGHNEFERFHTFVPFMGMVNLVKNRECMTPALAERFEKYICGKMPINLLDDWNFVGVNDNTPAMIMACCILAGEYFKEKSWLETGRRRLKQLAAMLERRGYISEFNSPTYTPITIYCLAVIADYAKDEECRSLALKLEQNLWEKKLALYQPEICNTAGPYSRAYEEDRRCRTYNNRYIFYSLFGDKCRINPVNTIFKNTRPTDFYFQLANVWIANGRYHCPKKLAEKALKPGYPRIVRGTAEISAAADTYLLPCIGGDLSDENLMRDDLGRLCESDSLFEYQGGVTSLTTYLDDGYSIGTATRPFHNGTQTDSFVGVYTNDDVNGENDLGVIFASYVINRDIDFRNDAGRKIAVQNKNSAMVLYRPMPYKNGAVESAKLTVVCDNLEGCINMLWADNTVYSKEKLMENDFKITLNGLSPICIEAGKAFVFLLPLVAEEERTESYVTVSHIENTLCLSIYNYNGAAKEFHDKGLCLMTNGFVCEMRSRKEFNSLTDFAERMKNYKVSDNMTANVHSRYTYTRETRYHNGDAQLAICYSPISEGIRYMEAGGKLVDEVNYEINEGV